MMGRFCHLQFQISFVANQFSARLFSDTLVRRGRLENLAAEENTVAAELSVSQHESHSRRSSEIFPAANSRHWSRQKELPHHAAMARPPKQVCRNLSRLETLRIVSTAKRSEDQAGSHRTAAAFCPAGATNRKYRHR